MKTNLRILLVEESRYQALLVNREITKRFPRAIVSVFHDGRAALDELRRAAYDAAVVDSDLCGFGSLGFVAALRQENIDVPVILVSPETGEIARINALRNGAAEFVVRDDSYHLSIPGLISDVIRNHRLLTPTRKLDEYLRACENPEIVNVVAATLAHEINNPLMTILGISELLLGERSSLGPELFGKISMIRGSAKRIESALKRLSEVAELEIQPTDSGGLISTPQTRFTRSTLS